MTVDQLREALAGLPGDAELKVWYEARTCSSSELAVLGAHIDADGVLYAFLDADGDGRLPSASRRTGYLS